jgi:glycosyltransferase involved in cell wall biosynthesis
MRVLQIIPTLSVRMGGPAFNVVGSARALRQVGVESTIFATDAAAPASATDRSSRVTANDLPAGAEDLDYRLFPITSPARLSYSPEMGRALEREIGTYDLVHIHTLFLYPQYAAFKEARKAGVPHIVSPRGALDPFLRQRGKLRKLVTDVLWQRRMLDTASALHLTSPDESLLIQDLKFKAPHRIVSNGINLKIFEALPDRGEFRKEFGIGPDTPLVLNHGRLHPKKGIDILIRAFARVKAKRPDAVLVIVGPDDNGLKASLEALARELGVVESVFFTGLRSGRALHQALAAADVWVLPSHTENFGVAVVEAAAAGLPVVISPHVNIAPDMQDADAAVVLDLSPESIADEVVRLIESPVRRKQLGVNAKAYAATLDWSHVAVEMKAMYEEAIAGTSASERTAIGEAA